MSVEFGLPLYALANETALVPWVGAVIAVESATGVVVTAALGRWMSSERLVSAVLFGAFVCASACVLIALSFAQRVGVIAAALVFGVLIGVGTTVVSFAVYLAVVELAPEDERERYMAAYGLSGSLRRILAPVLLLALVTSASGWGWMGLMCAVVGAAMAWLIKQSYISTSTEETEKV
jgi:MFS family permease